MAFLALDGLTASYGGRNDVLSDVTLRFAKGEVVGLIGPSGTGTSSQMRPLDARRHPPAGKATSGHAVVD